MRSAFRRLAVLLGVFGLVLRAVIAPGVMPDPVAAANGTFKLIICTGTGLQERAGRLPDNGPASPAHHGDHALCPFAAAGHVATAAEAVPEPGAPPPSGFEPAATPRAAHAITLHAPSARAPPRLA